MENTDINAEGILTLAKFHNNPDQDSQNKVITRTLGKYGVISSKYKGVMPTTEEFWIVRIIKNIKPNLTQGCFVLEPVKKVDYHKDIGKLLKGMYDSVDGSVLSIVTPKEEFKHNIWQLSLEDRKEFKGKAVLVKLDECILCNELCENVKNGEIKNGNS